VISRRTLLGAAAAAIPATVTGELSADVLHRKPGSKPFLKVTCQHVLAREQQRHIAASLARQLKGTDFEGVPVLVVWGGMDIEVCE
jgi:hypothetical protein